MLCSSRGETRTLHSNNEHHLNGQTCRIKFYPGLGFAPVIEKVKE